MAEPILRFEYHEEHGGYDMKPWGEGTTTLGVNYGDWTSKGYDGNGNKKAQCKVTISYSNVNWVLNSDNSVTVTGRITTATLKRTATGVPSVCHQDIWTWFGEPETQVSHYYVNTASSGTYDLLPAQYRNFSLTIPASNNPQEVQALAIRFKNRCHEKPAGDDHDHPPDEFRVGLFVTNPNAPVYRPGKILDNGNIWQSHNRTVGKDNILQGNGTSWQTMETSGGGELTDNPPKIMSNSTFTNMRKIGENA